MSHFGTLCCSVATNGQHFIFLSYIYLYLYRTILTVIYCFICCRLRVVVVGPDDLSPRSAVEVDEDDEAAPSLGGTYAAQPPPVVDTRGLSVQILEDSYAAPPPSGLPLFRMRMRRFFSQFALIKVCAIV